MTGEEESGGRPPVLVLGATGGQGGAVASALLSAGRPVRALVRDPGSDRARKLGETGAELAAGDFMDVAELTAAMRGADAAFAFTTPFGYIGADSRPPESGTEIERRQGRAIIEAAAAANLPFLLFSSVASALSNTGVPHFESKAAVERALANSGLRYAVVAPTYFYDNALGGYQDLLEGVLTLPLPPGRPLQQLDRSDLGSFAEMVLRDPDQFAGTRTEVASDWPTPPEMCDALSAAMGREVRFEETPMSAVRNPDMAAMWEFLRTRGYQVDIDGLRRTYPAVGWTTFTKWAERTFASSGRNPGAW
jgi:uncharacterized protein YbjT (DUF2867 family)